MSNPISSFVVSYHGSVALVNPQDEEAEEWLREHTDGQWWAGMLAVEPRYLEALLDGIAEEGYTYEIA